MDLREEIATLRALAIAKGGFEERKAVDLIEIALRDVEPRQYNQPRQTSDRHE